MKPLSTLSSVVFRSCAARDHDVLAQDTQRRRNSAALRVHVPKAMKSSTVSARFENFDGDAGADEGSGAMMALTREPSGRRAST
jgi:hypothetical protein